MKDAWIEATRRLGISAAHGLADRRSIETCLGYWCKLDPSLRGQGGDFVCWLYEQEREREEQRLDLAAYRVQRAVWPLFARLAPRAEVQLAAVNVNEGVLLAHELDAVLSDVCARAVPRHGRSVRR